MLVKNRQLKHLMCKNVMQTLEIHLTIVMLKCPATSHDVGLMFLAEAKLIVPVFI